MIREFSDGYYHAMMQVQEYDVGPVIEQSLYDFINRKLYADSDAPIMMRLGLDAGEVFEVGAEAPIPRDVLALPDEMFDEQDEMSVFILKPEHATMMGEYYG